MTPRWSNARHPGSRSGFTLVELIISSALLSVLLLAGAVTAGLVRRVALKATLSTSIKSVDALADLRRDISFATATTYLGASTITLTVPDRDGDGQQETLTYSWSGVPGEPLRRRVGSGAWADVAPGVQSFALSWETGSRVVSTAVQPTTPAEVLVASCVTSSSLKNTSVKNSAWHTICFLPSGLSADQAWTLTRIRLSLRTKGAAQGSFSVQIRPTNGGLPTTTVLGETVVAESSLTSSYGWVNISFNGIANLKPTAPVAIVLKWLSDTDACEFQGTGSGSAIRPSDIYASTKDSGASWSIDTSESMLYQVYGYAEPATTSTSTQTFVDTITVRFVDSLGQTHSLFVPTRSQAVVSGVMEEP